MQATLEQQGTGKCNTTKSRVCVQSNCITGVEELRFTSSCLETTSIALFIKIDHSLEASNL